MRPKTVNWSLLTGLRGAKFSDKMYTSSFLQLVRFREKPDDFLTVQHHNYGGLKRTCDDRAGKSGSSTKL